jgi:hypothetical protein
MQTSMPRPCCMEDGGICPSPILHPRENAASHNCYEGAAERRKRADEGEKAVQGCVRSSSRSSLADGRHTAPVVRA